MSNPLEAQSHVDDYFNLVPEVHFNEFRNGSFKVGILESPVVGNFSPAIRWRGRGSKTSRPTLPIVEVGELKERPASSIRILFPGLDEPDKSSLQGLRDLFENYHVPTVFLKERVQGAVNSFGTRDTSHNTQDSWFHFLCKNVVLVPGADGKPDICGPRSQDHLNAGGPSWVHAAFYLKWNKTAGNIILCCFGTITKIEERLKKFIENTDNVQAALSDPYVLYVVILDELHSRMNSILWDLISVFNHTEHQIFELAGAQQKRSSTGYEVNFAHIHNLEKLVIHLKEGSDAIIATARAMQRAHSELFKPTNSSTVTPHPSIAATEKDLEYMLGAFHSLNLRIHSVETRVKNVINLAFNLAVQRDSILLQKDSQSMKTIAVMALIFLPGTAVASMFGTQFFTADFSDGGVGKLKVSRDFWWFWILVLIVTSITLGGWHYWLKDGWKMRYSGAVKKKAAIASPSASSMGSTANMV